MLQDTGPAFVRGLAKNSLDLACLWGNSLHYTAHAGLHEDPQAFPGDRAEIDRWVSLQAALLLRSS